MESKDYAPVVIFAYNRPDHLKMVIESLIANKEAFQSDLIIYSDGFKNIQDQAMVEKVRRYLETVVGFKSISLKYRSTNLGLATSVIRGVTEVIEKYKKVIVLEDDIVVSKNFLSYMNEGLERYSHTLEVASIHGYVYPVTRKLPDVFFLRGSDCWGWATWSRAWSIFEEDANKLQKELETSKLESKFDFNGAYPYFNMLKNQAGGRLDSWAIRWYASTFIKGMLTLYPGRSLVKNIGFDGSGSNCGGTNLFDVELDDSFIGIGDPIIQHSAYAYDSFAEYFLALKTANSSIRGNFFSRSKGFLRVLLKKFLH